LETCRYVLYTNVSNGFSDEELAAFRAGQVWQVQWQGGGWPVRVAVLERQP